MNIYVVDACVVVKWFIPEIHSESAWRLHHPDYQLHVPGLLLLEFGNVVNKKQRRGEISAIESEFMINKLRTAPLKWHQDELLFLHAFKIAHETDRSLYDCIYLSLAILLNSQMVTADLRFYDALKRSAYATRLLWVENIP